MTTDDWEKELGIGVDSIFTSSFVSRKGCEFFPPFWSETVEVLLSVKFATHKIISREVGFVNNITLLICTGKVKKSYGQQE